MSEATPETNELYEAVLRGDAATTLSLTQEALAKDVDPELLLTESMIPAMDEVGRRFEAHEFFVPELLIAARAMKGAMDLIRPLLAESGVKPVGTVVIGTVKGDLHDIGKGLVASMLEGGGFNVVDLGTDVGAEKFIAEAQENGANIIALSALLTTTMVAMKDVVEKLEAAGLHDTIKVVIGGAPVTQKFCASIGADGYSETASAAVLLARELSKS